MRKFWLLFLIPLTSVHLVFAQTNFNFLDTNSVWCTSWGYNNGGTNPPYSVFSGRARFENLTIDSFLNQRIAFGFNHVYIEDLQNQRVYYVSGSDTQLLYDFNLNTGDTFWWNDSMIKGFINNHEVYDSIAYAFSIVRSRDSVSLLDQSQRLRLNLSNHFFKSDSSDAEYWFDDLMWIDGIGATIGWYYPQFGYAFESHSYFSAFFQDTNLLLQWAECYPVGVDEIKSKDTSVWPNPTDHLLNVDATTAILSIDILDLMGKNVGYSIAAVGNKRDLRAEMNVSSLPTGVYVIRVWLERGAVMRKFVKD